MRTRRYSELAQLESFTERYDYLSLRGVVGDATFGSERFLNQEFYRSTEWRRVRQLVIARDLGRDLGVDGYDLSERMIIHHMNPMLPDDLLHGNESILDPEFLITTSHQTHNAIHYGDASLLRQPYEERRPGDTDLWTRRR